MIQYARFSVICTSQKKEDKCVYKEFKNRMKNYLCDADMELYRIPITTEEYSYAYELSLKYAWNYENGNDWGAVPGLYINDSEYLETVYSKEDFAKGAAYVVNFWYFAYCYDDIDVWDFAEIECCEYSDWKYVTGYIQNKNLLIPSSEWKKRKYAKLEVGYALDKEVVDLLLENKLAVQEDFWEIKNKQGKIVSYQIKPQNVIAGFAKDNDMRLVDFCKNCGLERYEGTRPPYGEAEPYYISEETLMQLKGFNQTKETFGPVIEDYDKVNAEEYCSILEPWYIVSKEVYDLLIKKYPKMQFIPVFLKEKQK